MPTYKRSAVTAKEGVNFIRTAVETAGSLFIKIEQENDLGIDAFIDFLKDERPLNKQVAIQIKSGASYYISDVAECTFPVGSHASYWRKHQLPVFGLVYVPTLQVAFWINIKSYLQQNPDATVIRFAATEANRFDVISFTNVFLPAISGGMPELEFGEALRLAHSARAPEACLGLLVLFRRHPNMSETWDALVSAFKDRPGRDVPPILLYWLAHVPWHDDIDYHGQQLTPEIRAYARVLICNFGVQEVIKLLSFIDPEEQIARGTLGQSIEAIISSLPTSSYMLRVVINSQTVDMHSRELAALILAMNEARHSLPDLSLLHNCGSSYAGQLLEHLKEFGSIDPYG